MSEYAFPLGPAANDDDDRDTRLIRATDAAYDRSSSLSGRLARDYKEGKVKKDEFIDKAQRITKMKDWAYDTHDALVKKHPFLNISEVE